MSLIPFILDLADELHEFNRCLATGMDVDDFGFGIYPHELQQLQQQQQQQQLLRRPRAVSQLYWLPNSKQQQQQQQRHHPYNRTKVCCNKIGITTAASTAASEKHSDSEREFNTCIDKESPNTVTSKSAYSVVNKNGFQVSMNVKQFAPNELTVKTIDNCIVVEGRHDDKEDGHGVISRHFIRKYMLPKGYDPNEVLSTLSSDGILTVKAPPPPATKTDEPLERIVDIQQTGPAHLSVKEASKEHQQQQQQQQPQQAKPASAQPAATQQQQTAELQKQQKLQQQQQQQQQQQKQAQDLQQKQVEQHNGDANMNELNNELEETESQKPTSAVASNTNATNTNTSDNNNVDANAKETPTTTTIISTTTILPASATTEAAPATTAATPPPAAAIVITAAAAIPAPATAVTIDAIMAAATADEDDNYNEEDANANDITSINITNNDNGMIVDIPVGATTTNNIIANNINTNTDTIDDVDMETVAVTVLAPDDGVVIDGGMEEDATTDGVAVAVSSIAVDESATEENLVVAAAVDSVADADATQQQSAADLVAAADAAILLAKTQCENGNKSANEEIAN